MFKKKYHFIILIVFLGFCYFFGPKLPHFFTNTYNQKIYSGIDFIFRPIYNFIPFSVGDILYAALIFFILYKTYSLLKKRLYKNYFFFLLNVVLIGMSLFQLLWGLNNYKHSITYQLNLEQNYTQEELDTITFKLIDIVNNLQIDLAKNENDKIIIKKDLEAFNKDAKKNYNKLSNQLKTILTNNQINEVKPSLFSFAQSYAGFSGYFNPFTHENQINIEIPSIGMPVTVAHEMAHQLGIASESEANFFGYQTMKLSNDLQYQYAANLYALKYCLKEYRNKNEEEYLKLFDQLHFGVQQNITESEEFWQSKRNFSSFFFKHLYGRFLKINNQKDGMKSYNKFVDLLINYNKKYQEI